MELIDNITRYNKIHIIKYDNIDTFVYYKFLRGLICSELSKHSLAYDNLHDYRWTDNFRRYIRKNKDKVIFPLYSMNSPIIKSPNEITKLDRFIITSTTTNVSTSFTVNRYRYSQVSDLVIYIIRDKIKTLKDRYYVEGDTVSLMDEYSLLQRSKKIKQIYDRNKEIFR